MATTTIGSAGLSTIGLAKGGGEGGHAAKLQEAVSRVAELEAFVAELEGELAAEKRAAQEAAARMTELERKLAAAEQAVHGIDTVLYFFLLELKDCFNQVLVHTIYCSFCMVLHVKHQKVKPGFDASTAMQSMCIPFEC